MISVDATPVVVPRPDNGPSPDHGRLTAGRLGAGLGLALAGGLILPLAALAEPFDPAAATAAYLASVPESARARSDAYFEGGYWLQLWGFLYGLLVAWLLLRSGLAAAIRDRVERWVTAPFWRSAFFAALYLCLVSALSLPLILYRDFYREHHYGLATHGLGGFLRDQTVGLVVTVALLAPLIAALATLVRRQPRGWWLSGTAVAVGFTAVVLLLAPVYIDPLFNRYEPLSDGALAAEILAMGRANGVDVAEVYQFDASRQTNRISANVSGFLGTMAIRLNDNLLRRCSPAEIRAVMGHEIGHYALNHVYEGLVFLTLVLLGAFAWVAGAGRALIRRFGSRWRVRDLADPAALPLAMALVAAYFFVLTPVMNSWVRTDEAEADLFGLNAAREPDGFATIALMLGEYRKLDPGPLEEWLLFDHPSGRSRIRMAMEWKAGQQELATALAASSVTARSEVAAGQLQGADAVAGETGFVTANAGDTAGEPRADDAER